MNKFYITTAIPYVNAKPHIGHALEYVQADVIARYHRLLGEEVLLLSGGDENALKNVQAAEKAGVPVQEFIDLNNNLFVELTKKLNTQFDIWQKGSDQEHHYKSSQELWKLCAESGDIYQKKYKGLYCVGCEQFYEPEELNDRGECFEHPGKKLEEVEEENYFFKLSKYQGVVTKLIESGEYKIVPDFRKNEVLSFLKSGLKDISISRSNERARNWGVPVPGDNTQRIYVWFDALNIYQSGIGFGWDEATYAKWWPADLHVIGKGITRFHAVYWPAFLLSAKLPLPKALLVHGYYTVNGQKMSKTIGNVYDPIPLLEKFGEDPVRYYFLAKTPIFDDGDFSEEKFKESYNSDLANGLGNLVSRIAKLAETNNYSIEIRTRLGVHHKVAEHLDNFRVDLAIEYLWSQIKNLDLEIEKAQPWKLEPTELSGFLAKIVPKILVLAYNLIPFLPETANKIQTQFSGKIKSAAPLFPRII